MPCAFGQPIATASVVALREDDDPEGAVVGHAIWFTVPRPGGQAREVELIVGDSRSNQDQLDVAVVVPATEQNVRFDRVDAIDPPLAP